MSIEENLERVRTEIEGAAERAGRAAEGVTLVAVSKTWPVERISEAVEAGQTVFGENKVQELIDKVPVMSPDLEWHLIGHLQSNKTRKVLPLCSMIHSVDSLKLAHQIDRIAGEEQLNPKVLLQVNVASDDAKFGFPVGVIRREMEGMSSFSNLEVQGLMTVPPFEEDPEKVRPHFAALRELREELVEASGLNLPYLSMGMSHDFRVAIEEGATHVRVGSSIFGKRDYSQLS